MEWILLGTDYPYEEMTDSIAFLESLDLSQQEKELLYHRNAGELGIE
jgi:predicted TIM-barrel fold metal-dependent hydrolase